MKPIRSYYLSESPNSEVGGRRLNTGYRTWCTEEVRNIGQQTQTWGAGQREGRRNKGAG